MFSERCSDISPRDLGTLVVGLGVTLDIIGVMDGVAF